MTAHEAKKIVGEFLNSVGLHNRLTARRVRFIDLARDAVVFVTVHDWKPSPIANELKELAKKNGFLVDFEVN